MHVALIGYGEVGRILAEDLRAKGHAVTAFDLKLRWKRQRNARSRDWRVEADRILDHIKKEI